MIKDPKGLVEQINSGTLDGKLELGCGPTRKKQGYVTVDLLAHESVDIQADVLALFKALQPGTISAVFASHFIEHVDDLGNFLKELARVCQHGAVVEFVAPHFSNPFFYSDYTHKTFFGLYTFKYLARDRTGLRRAVPTYGVEPQFELTAVSLRFQSYRPNYLRHAIKRGVEKIVNLRAWTKELHEEMFAWIFPCYEVYYRLERCVDPLLEPDQELANAGIRKEAAAALGSG